MERHRFVVWFYVLWVDCIYDNRDKQARPLYVCNLQLDKTKYHIETLFRIGFSLAINKQEHVHNKNMHLRSFKHFSKIRTMHDCQNFVINEKYIVVVLLVTRAFTLPMSYYLEKPERPG